MSFWQLFSAVFLEIARSRRFQNSPEVSQLSVDLLLADVGRCPSLNIGKRILKAALIAVWLPIKEDSPPQLREALQEQVANAFQLVQNGSIQSSSGNGHLTSFANYGAGNITPRDTVAAWTFLLEEYDRAATELGAAPDGSQDSAIELQMEANLRPVMGYTSLYFYISK